jgi:hypothetical protein
MALLLNDSHRKIKTFSSLQADIPGSTGWDTFKSFASNLLILCASITYLQRGSEILTSQGIALSPTAALIASATAATGAFIASLFVLINLLPSGRAARRARRSVGKRFDDLKVVAEKSNLMVTEMVNELGSMKVDLSRHGHDCLALLQRINTALLNRVNSVLQLTASGSTKGFIQAENILNSDLILDENFVDSLISTKVVKPIPTAELASTVNSLTEEIQSARIKQGADGIGQYTTSQLHQQRAA